MHAFTYRSPDFEAVVLSSNNGVNLDGYFNFTLVNPYSGPIQNAFSILDADGHASASFMVPPSSDPTLAGLTAHHAFLTIDPLDNLSIDVISNAEPVTLVP